MKILFIGDIVGHPGREILSRLLRNLKEQEKPDFVIANAENAAGGKGLTSAVASELFNLGIDVLTLGNHSFDRKEVEQVISNPNILRPANYPPNVPGQGYGIYNLKDGTIVSVLNLMGRVYLPAIDCPFRTANAILEKIYPHTKNIFVDFHAEVTSEKQAMGWYLDGRVSAVIGTHTHIPTADEKIMPGGTAYLTDAGMTGPSGGIIGMDRDLVIKRFLTGMHEHYVIAKDSPIMQGCFVEIDSATGKSTSIRRFSLTM